MCKCIPKPTVILLGVVFTILMGAISIPCIVLSGVDYQQTDMRWTNVGSWYRTGPLKVGSIVVVFVSMILGLIAFTCASKSKPMQFVIADGLSTLLTFAIAVFVLVASVMGESAATKACVDQNSGLFEYFKFIETYFSEVDQKLCSDECKCRFTNDSAIEDFEQNANYITEYTLYYKTTSNKILGAIEIQNCDQINTIIDKVNSNATFKEQFGEQTETTFKHFATYWGRIEDSFKCTGWCHRSYETTTPSPTTRFYYKYLFSDINGGPVRNSCMAPVIKWVKKTLKAYGGLSIIISIIQGFLWALSFSLLTDLTGYSKSQRNNIEIEQQ